MKKSRCIEGEYIKERHVYAVGFYKNTIFLDSAYRSYWGNEWPIRDFTPHVRLQWDRLHVRYGQRVRVIIDANGIPLQVTLIEEEEK